VFEIITIPFERNAGGFDVKRLNAFVVNKRVKNYRAELFRDGGETYWTVFLEVDRPAGRSIPPRACSYAPAPFGVSKLCLETLGVGAPSGAVH
jgi:hypothetical protein